MTIGRQFNNSVTKSDGLVRVLIAAVTLSWASIAGAQDPPAAPQEHQPNLAPPVPEAPPERAAELHLEAREAKAQTDARVAAQLLAIASQQVAERQKALTSFIQLLGDATAQVTTAAQSNAAFGGGALYRGENQSLLILARVEATSSALATEAERGTFMLTPASTARPSFEVEWNVYLACASGLFDWYLQICSKATSNADKDKLDVGLRFHVSGGAADWEIPSTDPIVPAVKRRAQILAYGVDAAFRREFIKGQDNYVGLEAAAGLTARTLMGDLASGENDDVRRQFIGTERKFYGGLELSAALVINALRVGISLPIFPREDVDGFSNGQLLVTATVRDGPKLVIE